jgi:hypothetical protein
MRSLFVIVALGACSHRETPPPPAPQQAQTAPVTTDVPGSQNLAPLKTLGVRLAAEKQARPAVKVPAEKLFDALAAHGIALASHHQVLATTAAATYCDLGVTKDTVAIAVCEYATPDAAAKGKQLLDSRYAQLVPNAVRTINGSTLVTVAGTQTATRDEVIHTFLAL